MPNCVAIDCTNRSSQKKPRITFHKIPKDEERRKKWIKAIRRKNWTPSKYSYVCSEHFSEDLFVKNSNTVRLHETAVPNIFKTFPFYLQCVKKNSRKLPTNSENKNEGSICKKIKKNSEMLSVSKIDNFSNTEDNVIETCVNHNKVAGLFSNLSLLHTDNQNLQTRNDEISLFSHSNFQANSVSKHSASSVHCENISFESYSTAASNSKLLTPEKCKLPGKSDIKNNIEKHCSSVNCKTFLSQLGNTVVTNSESVLPQKRKRQDSSDSADSHKKKRIFPVLPKKCVTTPDNTVVINMESVMPQKRKLQDSLSTSDTKNKKRKYCFPVNSEIIVYEPCTSSAINLEQVNSQKPNNDINIKKVNKQCQKPLSSENTVFQSDRTSINSLKPPLTPIKRKLQRKLNSAESKIKKYRKKIRTLQQKTRRYKKRIETLKDLFDELKKKNLMQEDDLQILCEAALPNKELIMRQLLKAKSKGVPRSYSKELKAFALTLHYYSPRAYNYVRKTFNNSLPHRRTICHWYARIDGSPGFTQESLNALSLLVQKTDYPLYFSLVLDEMAIRQQVEFENVDFKGYVDMGTNVDNDCLPVAKDSLVLMAVGINCRWKVPVGYFLINGISASQKSNLITQCLNLLHSVDVNVVSLTFDGLSSNFGMAKNLGCSFDLDNINTSFPHPVTGTPVYVMLDPCHMLKLVRNTIGDKKILYDVDNNIIRWSYIKELNDLQESEGLRFGNKLTSAHIDFHKQKMKVRLASQLLSKSVADAIKFCDKELHLLQFSGSEATIKFIVMFNNLFDILNSRTIKEGQELKKAFCKANSDVVLRSLDEIKCYISSLKVSQNGESILESNRKTGFLGFLVCIESIKKLYEIYVENPQNYLKYLPTHKLSQDHLELFFQTIRFQGGCNNNPTAIQFRSAYKKLLIHTELKNSLNGNCIPLEKLSILTLSESISPESIINLSSSKYRCADDIAEDLDSEFDEEFLLHSIYLTASTEHIVHYIAGYVSFFLSKKLKCEKCVSALSGTPDLHSLISYKNRGNLYYPSKGVFEICKRCEQEFRCGIISNGTVQNHCKISQTESRVYRLLEAKNIFSEECVNCETEENHAWQLIRAVVKKYLTIRFSYWGKKVVQKSSMRHMYNKLILFSGR